MYINDSIDTTRQLCAYFNIQVFLNKYVYTTVLSFDIVAVDDEINFNSIQLNSNIPINSPDGSTYCYQSK